MKKIVLVLVVVVLALASVGIVGAQGPDGGRGGRGGGRLDGAMMDIIVAATGLEADELRDAMRDGQSLAELIEANGGDVAAVQAEIVAAMTADLPTEEDITARVEDLLTRTPGDRENLREVVEEVTGLDMRDLSQEARENDQTLAEVIEANGGDVAALTEALTAAISENRPSLDAEQVAEQVENFLNSRGAGRGGRGRGFGL